MSRVKMPTVKPRILVVDDNKDTATLATLILNASGYDVDVVHDGLAAVNLAGMHEFDLVLLDLRLPGMDGIEVCRTIKAKNTGRYPFVMFFTVSDLHVDREKAFEAGADGYLVKPFRADDLVARINEALERES